MKQWFIWISLIIFTASHHQIFAQETDGGKNKRFTPLNPEEGSYPFEIAIDGYGALLLPLAGIGYETERKRFRGQVSLTYNVSSTFFLDLALGIETARIEERLNNFDKYRMRGFFAKPTVNVGTASRSFYFGVGLFINRQKESGTVRLDGDYFDDFTNDLSHTVNNSGIVFKTGSKQRLSDRFSLGFELNMLFGGFTVVKQTGQPDLQNVEHIAGAGINIFNRGGPVSLNSCINLIYHF